MPQERASINDFNGAVGYAVLRYLLSSPPASVPACHAEIPPKQQPGSLEIQTNNGLSMSSVAGPASSGKEETAVYSGEYAVTSTRSACSWPST
jgi:hypothetical protein